MLALVLRGFLQRKLRVLLTAIAIALGVALMAGTYILTDTINHSFAGIFQTADKGHDVGRSRPTRNARAANVSSETSPITEATLAQVRAVPGVAAGGGRDLHARPRFLDTARQAADHRRTRRRSSARSSPKRFESFTPVRGASRRTPSEVAIDQATAEREDLKLGEQM